MRLHAPSKGKSKCDKASKCAYCSSECVAVVNSGDPVCEAPNSLYAHCTKMRVHIVDLNGNKYTYLVDPNDKLKSLRELSADDSNMDVKNVLLANEDDEKLDEYLKSLDKLSIEDEDTLYMYYFIHVVDFGGKKHTFNIHPDTSVDELKKEIKKKTGIEVEDQDIITKMVVPVEDGKLYADNGVVHDQTLYLRAPCPSVKHIVKCTGLKGKACLKKGKGVCTKCGEKMPSRNC